MCSEIYLFTNIFIHVPGVLAWFCSLHRALPEAPPTDTADRPQGPGADRGAAGNGPGAGPGAGPDRGPDRGLDRGLRPFRTAIPRGVSPAPSPGRPALRLRGGGAMALETVPKDLRHLRACLLCSLVKVRPGPGPGPLPARPWPSCPGPGLPPPGAGPSPRPLYRPARASLGLRPLPCPDGPPRSVPPARASLAPAGPVRLSPPSASPCGRPGPGRAPTLLPRPRADACVPLRPSTSSSTTAATTAMRTCR